MRPDWDRYTSHHHSSTTHRRAGADVRRREQRRNWAYRRAFPVLMPLVFASSAFIPVSTMPWWLQGFARHQPVSVTASAVRALVLGGPTSTYVWQSVAWLIGIIIVFAPLGVWRYRHAV